MKGTIQNSDRLIQNYTFVPLSVLIDRYGPKMVQTNLGAFVPCLDDGEDPFIRHKAITMERRDLSRTYLAISLEDGTILGYVTIGLKCMRVPKENMLSNTILKQMNIEKSTGVTQSYLFGQLARSKQSSEGFGDKLIDYAMKLFRDAKSMVGCRMVRLDCSDNLVQYYEKHGFKLISKNQERDLNQMMIFI